MLALVPAFNEEDVVALTVEALNAAVAGVEIFVIDDGSTDATAAEAEKAGAVVIRMKSNLGKGGAVNAAFAHLAPEDEDVLLLIDADLGATAAEADKITGPVLDDEADMAVAGFGKAQKKGGFGLVKGLASWGIRRLGGRDVSTPLSGQRVLRARVFRDVAGLEGGYGMEVGLTIDVLRKGYRVVEVPTSMSHRESGRDIAGFRHRGGQFIAVAWALVKRVR